MKRFHINMKRTTWEELDTVIAAEDLEKARELAFESGKWMAYDDDITWVEIEELKETLKP